MSKKKLVSLEFSMTLVVHDGKDEQTIRFSGRCPSKAFTDPYKVLMALCDHINDEFGTQYYVGKLSTSPAILLKPKKKVDSVSKMTHEEFNQKIKELVG